MQAFLQQFLLADTSYAIKKKLENIPKVKKNHSLWDKGSLRAILRYDMCCYYQTENFKWLWLMF